VGLRVGSFVGLRVGYLVGPEVGRRDGDGVTPVSAGAKLQVFIPPLICGSSLTRKFDVDKPSLIGQQKKGVPPGSVHVYNTDPSPYFSQLGSKEGVQTPVAVGVGATTFESSGTGTGTGTGTATGAGAGAEGTVGMGSPNLVQVYKVSLYGWRIFGGQHQLKILSPSLARQLANCGWDVSVQPVSEP